MRSASRSRAMVRLRHWDRESSARTRTDSPSIARARLAARDEGRADDADRDVIARRLAVYHEQTAPLLDYYRDRGALVTVDADQPPEAVAADIDAALAERCR